MGVIRVLLCVGLMVFAIYEFKQLLNVIKERKKQKSEKKAKSDKEILENDRNSNS